MNIPMSISNLITKAARVVGREYQRECAPLGITPPQAGVVWVLSIVGPTTQVKIAGLLHLEKTNINAMVKKLVVAGVVHLRKVADDGRKIEVCLTRKGHVLSNKLKKVDERVNEHFLELFDNADDAEVVRHFLSRIVWPSATLDHVGHEGQ